MQTIFVERKSAVLAQSSLRCLQGVASVNLTEGCAHGCIYCYTRSYRGYPGEGVIRVYKNTVEKLREELRGKRSMPRLVYFSPSSDLFQPVPEVLELAEEILTVLLEAGIHVAFLTKGRIPGSHMDLLLKHSSQVHAQIGLITLDKQLAKILEPNAAPPLVRLEQLRTLTAAGIPTMGRLDPIFPGLTDSEKDFRTICAALREAGTQSLAASILFLRAGVVDSLKKNLPDETVRRRLFHIFQSAVRLPIHADCSSVKALPVELRGQIFQRLQNIAEQYSLHVHICGCKNPDISSSCCHIAGKSLSHDPSLPLFPENHESASDP